MVLPKIAQVSPGGQVFFKAVWRGNIEAPLETKSEEGRYHTRMDMDQTMYLATTPETAMQEVAKRWGGDPAEYTVVSARVKLSRCADLTAEETQGLLKVSEDDLTGNRWRSCQQVAASLRARGYEAVLTYSAADRPKGRCLIIFTENFKATSGVELE